MKTPTLIGTLIFGMSILVIVLAALPPPPQPQYFELFLIWIFGGIGGVGLGYGSRESFGYSEGSTATIIGGLGLALCLVVSFLMYFYGKGINPPIDSIIIAFVSAILEIVGLYMLVVSTQESY